MQLFKSLLAGATLVASAVAAQGRLRFTSFNPTVEVGDPVTVTWAGGQEGVCCREYSPCVYANRADLDSLACHHHLEEG